MAEWLCGVLLILFTKVQFLLMPKKKRNAATRRIKGTNEHVEIGKQSSLKMKWALALKSSSLFVRN